MKSVLGSKTIWINLVVIILTGVLQWARGLQIETPVDPSAVNIPGVVTAVRDYVAPNGSGVALAAIAGLAGLNIALRGVTRQPLRWF